MHKIKVICHWLKLIFFLSTGVIWATLTWILRYAKHIDKYPYEKRYNKVQKLMKYVVRHYNLNFIVDGLENIPETSSYFACNHYCGADPVILTSIFPSQYSFVAKQEVVKIPIIGKACKIMGGLFLPREDLKTSLRVMMKVQESLSKNEHHWAVFVEGTRNRDPLHNTFDFHPGSFRPAIKAGVPIVPVAIYGSHRVFQSKFLPKKYPIQIKFFKPLMPNEYQNLTTDEVARKVHDMVAHEIAFNMIKKDKELMSKMLPKYDHYYLGKTI